MLWLKAFHIIFVVTWFAGLFYLPRLFVYHALSEDSSSRARFVTMERKLFIIMTIGGVLTVILGIALILANPSVLESTWLRAKLGLVAGLLVYHAYCRKLMRDLERDRQRDHVWYRWFNEIPALALVAIVILAVVKPSF